MGKITVFDDDVKKRIVKIFKYYVKEHPSKIKVFGGSIGLNPRFVLSLDMGVIDVRDGYSITFKPNNLNKFDGDLKINYLEFESDEDLAEFCQGTTDGLEQMVYSEYQKITEEKLDGLLNGDNHSE